MLLKLPWRASANWDNGLVEQADVSHELAAVAVLRLDDSLAGAAPFEPDPIELQRRREAALGARHLEVVE